MATRLGTHSPRLRALRALRTVRGRREQQRFAFEGPTLLAEAVAAGFPINELYATEQAYDSTPLVPELEAAGTPLYIVSESAAMVLSDLTTPNGILAASSIRLHNVSELLRESRTLLVLADLNDPANAGTLLRSADAFGAGGVIFGGLGVDPHNPKVVRGSMGAFFRLSIGVAEPAELSDAAAQAGVRLLGLAAGATPISAESWDPPLAIVVGNERHGLGRWQTLCERLLSIPMRGRAESLSASVAGSIALYEAGLIDRAK